MLKKAVARGLVEDEYRCSRYKAEIMYIPVCHHFNIADRKGKMIKGLDVHLKYSKISAKTIEQSQNHLDQPASVE